MFKRMIPAAVFALVAIAGTVQAQNLLNNSAYKKAVELRNQAQSAFSQGNYNEAEKLSQSAESYARKAVDLAGTLALGYRADNLLQLAKARIRYGESVEAATRYPAAWATAQQQISAAQSDYATKEFKKSMAASRAVLGALKDIHGPSAVASAQSKHVLPKYYVVRLFPNRHDCFWRIAGYPFVYGDPLKWPILYRANKGKLQDPNNPNLIQPGMVFVIPSINGEKRQGTYDPNGKVSKSNR